jgi:APA family basic amino acid/polyamine antiporter
MRSAEPAAGRSGQDGAHAAAAPGTGRRGLLRVLGAAFGIAMVVGATIGGGILGTPGGVAAQLPNAALFMAVWAFGALNAFLGATAYAELGTMIPRSGGIYNYARRAMGDGVGFFVGFTDWLNWSVASAALILLTGEYLGALVPALSGRPMLAGFALFFLLVLFQWRGVKWGGRMQQGITLLKTLAFVGLIVAALVLPHPEPAGAPARAMPEGLALVAALALALQGVVFTYDSYYSVVYCGAELRDPGRDIPRSIFRGLLVVSVIYLLANWAFVSVMSIEGMAGDPFVGGTVARRLFGELGDTVIRVIMMVSVMGTVNAQILAAPRILHAMSEDGLLPRQATAVNEGGTPSVAMLLSVAMVAAFLLSGSFAAALAVETVLIVLLYVLVFTSLFVLRHREPAAPRPYRAFGYPLVPGLALLIALVILGMLVYADPKSALITLGLLVASWPVSRVVRRIA